MAINNWFVCNIHDHEKCMGSYYLYPHCYRQWVYHQLWCHVAIVWKTLIAGKGADRKYKYQRQVRQSKNCSVYALEASLISELSRLVSKCIMLDCCESPIIFLKEDKKAKYDVVIEDRICRKICTALTNMWNNTASMIRRSSILVTVNNPNFYRGMIDRFGRK